MNDNSFFRITDKKGNRYFEIDDLSKRAFDVPKLTASQE